MDSTTQLTALHRGPVHPLSAVGTPARASGPPDPSGADAIAGGGPSVYGPGGAPASLHLRASRVLEDNWTGTSTVPSRGLYPHQWSWDSAFIAIGLRHLSPLRAQTELETLLGAQWADGRVPHIVFNPSVPLDAYFPSPDFWRSSTAGRAAGAPRTVQTSGIVQPPVHALAVWLVHRADPGLSRARSFLSRMYPRLAAWHRYLLHRRDLGGGGLASVVHPWEQGMDNSPCWDGPLGRVTPAPARSFRRADLDHGAPEDRPTDLDYGRYVRLAADYRDRGYADGGGAFAVEDPLFNALLIASEHALARIARELGATGTARHARAERLTAALVERLWDPAEGMFFCRDERGGQDTPDARRDDGNEPGDGGHGGGQGHGGGRGRGAGRGHGEGRGRGALIRERSVAGLLPLILPALPREIAATLVRTACGPHFGLGGAARLAPSYDLTGEAFDPHRYWRGPAWFNTNWLLEQGLRLHGEHGRADALRAALLDTAGESGFAEYVDPFTGEACGAAGFSWTAALTLDLLHEPSGAEPVVSPWGRDALTDTAHSTTSTARTSTSTSTSTSVAAGTAGGGRRAREFGTDAKGGDRG